LFPSKKGPNPGELSYLLKSPLRRRFSGPSFGTFFWRPSSTE
jgi:hypothetical protein